MSWVIAKDRLEYFHGVTDAGEIVTGYPFEAMEFESLHEAEVGLAFVLMHVPGDWSIVERIASGGSI